MSRCGPVHCADVVQVFPAIITGQPASFLSKRKNVEANHFERVHPETSTIILFDIGHPLSPCNTSYKRSIGQGRAGRVRPYTHLPAMALSKQLAETPSESLRELVGELSTVTVLQVQL
ncbi:hypothetical protein RRG08_035890 [Elysia crispata]|uniref:Uncharacterized protein n=1 Tax=Elysia crispata TaxID=231223 RepID=A0AAE1A2J3_9GAST|nr:hypothetical protein RRG08_035890 [Elysia crispata]